MLCGQHCSNLSTRLNNKSCPGIKCEGQFTRAFFAAILGVISSFGGCKVLHWKTLCRNHASAVSSKVENKGNFSLEETKGRPWKLFLAPQDTAIAHCVSCDFQMDKGIAKQFLKQYGNLDELTEKGLSFPEGQEVGKIGILKTRERFVYYLMTRQRWWDYGSLEAMEQSLRAMQAYCVDNGIKTLAIPRLGAQCDRLEWDKVRGLIIDIFKYSAIDITAYTHR